MSKMGQYVLEMQEREANSPVVTLPELIVDAPTYEQLMEYMSLNIQE